MAQFPVITKNLHFLIFSTGLREYFSQTDERPALPRIPAMVNMSSASVLPKKGLKLREAASHNRSHSHDQTSANKNSMIDEDSDEDGEQIPDDEVCAVLGH